MISLHFQGHATACCQRCTTAIAILVLAGGNSVRAQSPSAGAAQSDGQKVEASGERRAAAVDLIREDQLVGLPLNGRSYSTLATLQTGVSDSGAASASRGVGGGNLSVAGGRNTANIYLNDGTNVQNAGNQAPRSAAGVQLGSDSIFQVQVYGTTYSAEYGRGTGGVLHSITRSGADPFHGTLFEFWRNSKLDARNFFDERGKPPFKRNQFGGLFSGPLRKGKTYFMGSFEAMRDRLTDTDISFTVTNEARAEGILRDCDFRGQEKRVDIHPSMTPYLALYTAHNGADRGCGVGETIGNSFQPVDEDFYVVRLDHQISQRDSGFLRYSFDDADSTSRGALFAFENLTRSRQQYLTLVASHIFSPRTVSSFRAGYTRPTSTTRDNSEVQIPPELNFVPNALQFGIIHVDGLTDFGPSDGLPQAIKMNTFQYAADVVLRRGPHSFKLGAQAHRYRWDDFTNQSKWAIWGFNSVESLLQAGPEATTNFIVALPGAESSTAFRQTLAGFYVQDALRVSSRLDLDLGLRYEITSNVHERDGKSAALLDIVRDSRPVTGSLLSGNPSLKNFSPRIGLTWAPWAQRDTLVSAGFGVFHDQILYYLIDAVKNTTPYYQVAVVSNVRVQGIFPDALAAARQGTFRLSTKTLDYDNIKLPSVLRYHFTLQQPFAGGWTMRAGYVGTRGNHLMRGYEANNFPAPIRLPDGSLCFPPDESQVRARDINPLCAPVSPSRAGPINPAFNSIELYSTDAQSFYNSLQVSVNKVPARGMSMQFSYTWSKSVDDASNMSPIELQFGFDRKLDRGLSNGDQRHRIAVNYFLTTPRAAGSPLLSRLLGRWRLGGIVGWRNGSPFSARLSVRRPGYLYSAARSSLNPGFSNNPTSGMSAGCRDTPDNSGAPRRDLPAREVGDARYYFDPCAFSLPSPGTVGNAGRNTIITPNVFTMDVSLQRDFVLGGEKRLQFRAEMFNVPNHPSLGGPPNGSQFIFTGSNGNSNSRIGAITRTATTSRQLQFALRFSF